jgi:tagatose-1,6-bisphosphate aldolase
MFIFLDFSLNTSRPIKKKGVKIFKTEYAVFVQYEVEQTYKKIRTIGQHEEMSCLISNGMRHIIFHSLFINNTKAI